jgi:hypothetical protein
VIRKLSKEKYGDEIVIKAKSFVIKMGSRAKYGDQN